MLLDLKGRQYRGSIFPGPTAMVLSIVQKKGDNVQPQIRIESVTDEFCRLVKTGEAMDKLQAKVQGDVDHNDYAVGDVDDVNRPSASETAAAAAAQESASQEAAKAATGANKKRKPAKGSGGASKKRKGPRK